AERNTLQAARNDQVSNLSEAKTASDSSVNGVAFRYTNQAWPTGSGWHVLTVNYYDDYSFPGAPAAFPDVEGQPVYYNLTVLPKGLPTGSWTRILETALLTKGEISYMLYDHKARPIRTRVSNHLGGYTQTDSKLEFSGKILYTVTEHMQTAGASVLKIREDFTYTDQDRLLSHSHKIGAKAAQLMAYNRYDELGQLISKKVGSTDLTGNTPFQKIDYAYNIRGWLKGINNTDALFNAGGDPGDLFAFRINYDRVENTTGYEVKPLYNGNIAETFWRTASDNYLRSYDHAYDAMNRLTRSFYQKEGAATHSYNEDIQYDRNGNIKGLQRNGASDGSVAQGIDILTYTYDPQKQNMLRKVMDASLSPQGFRDDSDGITDPVDDYDYDDFGNMTADQNKGITQVTYNHLNLPTKILFGGEAWKIEYLYTADGRKVRKTAPYLDSGIDGGIGARTMDYLGGFHYQDGILRFFPTAEGYVDVTKNKVGYSYSYVFNYTDHLGNIRLSYAENPQLPGTLKVLEENHYYPFGLKHTNYNSDVLAFREKDPAPGLVLMAPPMSLVPQFPYNYKYNGKEFQDEMGMNIYDYGARNYDPALGRWMNIDPMAESYEEFTPYNYVLNNPIYFIDPNGEYVSVTASDGTTHAYMYVKDRSYEDIEDIFLRQTYMALDKLYSSGAMNIDFGNNRNVNVLTELMESTKFTVNIYSGSSNGHLKNNISFNSTGGVVINKSGASKQEFETAEKTGKLTKNLGRNSPTAQLGHELIHAWNYNFDFGKRLEDGTRTGMSGRLLDYSTSNRDDFTRPHYRNMEEKYTTTLSNQINRALKEDERWDHRGFDYKTISPTSTKPSTVKP
ncbi:MAG: RHS repeat-associated core domain-containing protein, partial [Flavobacterium lindanitolerans]|uniref:RHS repeat domain-containing protein n=1 Tax=Flavobacterium lindanitolerans TaxID=428988 RepID=UPI001A63C552